MRFFFEKAIDFYRLFLYTEFKIKKATDHKLLNDCGKFNITIFADRKFENKKNTKK